MTIIIAGGRNFNDYFRLERVVDTIIQQLNSNEEIQIVSGRVRGTDSLGEQYARNRNYKVLPYPANWYKYGKSAGYIRNEQMAKVADVCICFWDGRSKGTKHMIDLAMKYNLKLFLEYY